MLNSNDNESTFRNNFEIIKRNKEQYDVFDDMELDRLLQDLQNVDREETVPFPKVQPLNTLMRSSGLWQYSTSDKT